MAPYPADHAGLEILPFDRCLQLLTTVPAGRVSGRRTPDPDADFGRLAR